MLMSSAVDNTYQHSIRKDIPGVSITMQQKFRYNVIILIDSRFTMKS
jgi:hypothetical protein